MVTKLLIFFRWIGFAALIAVTFRFIVFLVKLVDNPYTVELREDHFFIDSVAALILMGIDHYYRHRLRGASPSIGLGARFFRHFYVLSWFVALLIVGAAFAQMWRATDAYFLSFRTLRVEVFIGLALTALYVAGVTGAFILDRWRQSLAEVERYKKENLQVRLETLRAQINPHFLFNSLNTLSSLIYEDPDRATTFLRRISQVYRHVLEIRDRETVKLREEWQLLEAYRDLIQTRFEDRVEFTTEVPDEALDKQLPPLCLQLLIENALKHNEVSLKRPLQIELMYSSKRKTLLVRNNYQPKQTLEESTRVGLKNIQSRYQALTNRKVQITQDEHFFTVELPLLWLPEKNS